MAETGNSAAAESSAPQRYRFGPFLLDQTAQRLSNGEDVLTVTPKAFETLLELVRRAGEVVGREELLESVWPGAFVEESVLTQNVYTLRKLLDSGGEGTTYIETVPRHGYRFVAPVERERPPKPSAIASLAVLPFRPLIEDDENRVLGLGMADALVVRLSQVEGLAVRPTSAVRPFAEATPDVVVVARQLGVEGVLDGSIQRSADRVRVTVQLVAPGARGLIWADSFDSTFTDIFGVQDSIAAEVTRRLELELVGGAGAPRPARVPPAAYEAYLTGRYFWNRRTAASLDKAAEAFAQAIELAPEYARAYAGLADSYVLQPLYGSQAPRAAFPKAIDAAAAALALESRLAEAHTTLAYSRFLYEWSWSRAEESFRRAIQLDPQYATAHHWYAYFLVSRGRFSEAIGEIERAASLDPLSLVINADHGMVLYFAGEFAQALSQFERTHELDRRFAYGYFGRSLALEATGELAAAVETAARAVELSRRSSVMLGALGRLLGVAGRTAEAREILSELSGRARREYVSAAYPAMVYTGLGDIDEALLGWQRAAEERSRFFPFCGVWPIFDRLAEEPKFKRLAAAVAPS